MDRQALQTESKKALSETVLLSDGKYGYIISEIHENGVDKWECHVCCKIINTERGMLMHLSHPLHMSKLRNTTHPTENFRRKISKEEVKKKNAENKVKKEDLATNIIEPGEPIPPGMEDVVKEVCQLQESIDKHPGPIIGIEYIVELVSSETKAEPRYICLLCEKKGDPRSVIVHLASTNHAVRYISCFFRTTGNALNMIPKVKEYRRGFNLAVSKITEEIEKTFGRLKPTSAVLETFGQNKYDILRAIDEKEHFRESPDTIYTKYCTEEAIKEFAQIAMQDQIKKKYTYDESELLSNARNENYPEKNNQAQNQNQNEVKPLEARHPDSKLSFSIGKPERSLGRPKPEGKPAENNEDDDVVIVSANFGNDPIEIHSMSSISSASDDDMRRNSPRYRGRSRSWSRGRDRRGGGRGRSPYRRSPHVRRRPSPGPNRDYRYRSRTRSRSRSRGRFYRDRERIYRREIDKIYNRDSRRSRSKDRYDGRRRYDRRSISMERDRRRMSPYRSRSGKSPSRSSPHRSKYDKSPEPKRKKVVSEYQAKMDEYRAKLHELEVEMDNKLKFYKERPEKHPQYSEEWKSFWNRRYKELQQSGKDPTGYDFKPEWIVYWDERVKQLHEEEVAIKKEDLKELMPKEEKPKDLASDLQDVSPPTPESMRDVTVDDIKNTWKALTGSDIKGLPKTKGRSPTPERKPSPSRRSPSPWEMYRDERESGRKQPVYLADPPIVHCLRMLSVVEHQLGSLGPKALELLSQAILLEKVKRNDSMQLLQDPEVHIFFETVKEKIRGQLIAGIVVRYLVNSCRSLINHIENMLASNPLKPKALQKAPAPAYTPLQPEPVKVEGVGLVNKMAVAQQIAEVLVSQGRTDVSQQELEDLINAVVGIASNSNANVNQSPTAFFSQLNIQKSTANPHINELLSNLISSAQKSIDTTEPSSLLEQPPPVTQEPRATFPNPLDSPSETISKPSTQLHAAPLLQVLDKPISPNKPETLSQLSPSIKNTKTVVPLLQISPNAITSKIPSKTFPEPVSATKAFSESVSVAKATVSEQITVKPKPDITPVKEKPLFPIKDSIAEDPKEKDNKFSSKVSDDELKEKLLKFKTLSREEQQSLISLLKELEGTEPVRVEKLRKYVTAGLTQAGATPSKQEDNNRLSPFSSRAGGTNPGPEDRSKTHTLDSDNDNDEDDDDYTVEDIYKSVSEKLKKKETERKPETRLNQPDLGDENSSLSSYSNPIRPSSPLSRIQPKNIDIRGPSSNSQVQNPYAGKEKDVQPIPDRFKGQAIPSIGYPPNQGSGWPRSTFSLQTPGGGGGRGSYPPPPSQGDYYGGGGQGGYQGYPPMGPGPQYPPNSQYPPGPNSQYPPYQQQHYSQQPPLQPDYSNQAQAAPPSYNYPIRPQDQSYYGNYRQY